MELVAAELTSPNLAAVISAASAILGAGAGAVAAWAGVRRTADANERIARQRMEHESRERDQRAREEREEFKRSFERGTAVELQEALTHLMRATAALHEASLHAMSAGSAYGASRREQWTSEVFIHGLEVNRLRVRVDDEEARELAGSVQRYCAAVGFATEARSAMVALQEAANHFEAANVRLGSRIRELC
jgi:hypothetical protein